MENKIEVNRLALTDPSTLGIPPEQSELITFLVHVREVIYAQQTEIVLLRKRVKDLEP